MIKWLSILLAIGGLVLGLVVVITTTTRPPEIEPAGPPSINPFPRGIAATGLIEAASRNLELGPAEPGTVAEVFVQVNDSVTDDQALFRLDSRALEAERLRAVAAGKIARARLDRLQAAPRAEDLAPLVAAVDRAQAKYDDAKREYEQAQQVYAQRAAGSAEVAHRKNAMLAAKAVLDQAQAEHDRLAAGAWKYDLAVAEASLEEAYAAVRAIEMRIERMTVRSPVDGIVLRREVEPGEFVAVGSPTPAMVVGDLSALHVRAQVDEEDAGQLVEGAEAVGMIRGPDRQRVPLEPLRIEPMAVPKQQLANSPIELVDTRVVQVIYRVEGDPGIRLYPGQLIDVFISTQP